MASSPSSRSTRYSREDYRGCMGGIIHLFDFNQALAGRKFLTDKIRGEGLEAAAISPGVGSGIPEAQRLNTRKTKESLFARHESSKGKKPSGTPIKSLRGEELSEEPEPSDRTPNVVARLMGLDALPADSKVLKKSPSMRTVEKPVLKTPSDRKCHEEKPFHNVKTSPQKAIASPVHHLQDLATSKHSHNYRAHRENDITSGRNNKQDKQPHDLQNDFEAWQNQKSGNHCSRSSVYDDLDLQWDAKHRLAYGKLHEAKLGFCQENLSCTKHSSPQERLHESKEFLDAMNFLQCNKEFFMRFLQDPKPLFPKHPQDNQDDPVLSQPTQAAKYSQSYQSPDRYGSRSEACKLKSSRKESPESKRSYKSEQQFQQSQGTDALVERNLVSNSSESLVRDVSVVQDREEMDISLPMHNRPRTSTADCHVPTRIVVLKPSPGRTRNLNSPPLNYQRSLKDAVDEEIIWGDHGTVLQEMKERLRKESRENYTLDKSTAWLSLDEHGREILKDQREIAQKIARQVKEYATRDSRAVSGHVKSSNSMDNGTLVRRNQPSTCAIGGNMPTGSDGETAKRLYSDQYSRNRHMSPCQNKQLDMQAEHESKEGKRRSLGQCRTLNAEQLVEPPMQVQNGFSRKIGFIDHSSHCLPGPKSSNTIRALGRHSVDGTSKNNPQIPFPVITDKNMEIGYSLGHGESVPITLLRSRSVPLSSASVNENWEENDLTKAVPCKIESNESHVEKAVNTLTADSGRLAEATTRSIFSRKVSGLKSSFSLRRKQMVSKEHGDQISSPHKEQTPVQGPIPIEKSTAEKVSEGICAASQKDNYQIEDSGSVVENESSVSLVDHFLSLEPSMSAEDHKHVDSSHTSQQFSKASMTTDSNIGQRLEQENQEINAENEREIMHFESLPANSTDISASINTELPKEQSEQPSPVSVLDVPFLEDSASPLDFNEISSELQELRMHLRLLKFDEPWTDLDTSQGEDSLATDENLCTENEIHPQTADLDSMFDSTLFSSQPEFIDFAMDKMGCPSGKEPEMLYVKDLLLASGFTGDSTAILTLWYAPSQPLDPFLFQKVESNYSCKESIEGHAPLNPAMRHLLFDQVNDVLLELLWPYLNHRPWMKHGEVTVSSMPTGKDLLNHVWAKVSRSSCSQSECQETLEILMTKDLVKAGHWMDRRVSIETVGLEVERAIFHDLIEETLLVL